MRATRWLHHLLDLVYVPTCAACGAGADRRSLCADCEVGLAELEARPACRACAMPLVQAGDPCPYCMGGGAPFYERIVRMGGFHPPLSDLVHEMKYGRRWPLGEELADRLLEREDVKAVLAETQCLLAVPMHWRRQVKRGYNQAEVIARRLSRRCGIPVARAVVRVRPTESQTHQHSHAQRMENLRDAFGLTDAAAVRGRHVTVVDDVMTTGATLQSVARVVARAKPAGLRAVVLGVADPRGRDFQVV